MSGRKLKQNNENLCPISSKRPKSGSGSPLKSGISQSWVAAKIESTSSPTGLSAEYLNEMGIGLLDSEESSSSASSALNLVAALAASTNNADENCNEVTPSVDAPKFIHQQRLISFRLLDQTQDESQDGNNSLLGSSSNDLQSGSNNNSLSSNFEIFTDEASQHSLLVEQKGWLQHKAVALLAVSPNSGSNSPSSVGANKRSPLATVVCNSQRRNTNPVQQTVQQQSPNQLTTNVDKQESCIASTPSITVAVDNNVISQKNSQQTVFSSSQPSTSQQAAAVLKQHQQLHQLHALKRQQHLQQIQQHQTEAMNQTLPDAFFLFRGQQMREHALDRVDHFSTLSDEIILQIFKWLPKKALLRCGSVCRRFQRCAADESLWARLDLGSRSLRPGVIDNIFARGVIVLRLAQANLREPVFPIPSSRLDLPIESKLQYLDLSLVQIDKLSLKSLLSRCRQLKKLSLEHVPLNDDICTEIAKNVNLEALNLAMCSGLEAWSVRKLLEALKNLNSLNISWTNLSVDAVTAFVTNVTSNLLRLNIAGCRKTMFDSHIASLAERCPQLLELDLSDCTGLTGNAIVILCNFKMIEYLSLSRCYLIPASSYLELRNLSTLAFLDVFGTLSDPAMELLERTFPTLGINKFVHSSVARPTVGTRRTSIWGLRTRD